MTTSAISCIYEVNKENLKPNEPLKFAEGVIATLTDKGTVEFTFPYPRKLSDIKLQAAKQLEAIITSVDGETTKTSLLPSTDQPTHNDIPNGQNVIKVEIKSTSDVHLKPEDITLIEIVACVEGKFVINYS